jgi:ketopantoate reductase
MLQDVEAGRAETEALIGSILEMARIKNTPSSID